jgi:pimeloyl-ACP methyl ester carboxylesterase
MKTVQLPAGPVSYRESGSGDPILFVHGFLNDGDLWREVVPLLDGRVIAPTWPLGSHRTAMRADADLTPPGLARIVADFTDELELEKVTLVGNDTGGAVCQLVATRHPERLGRLVLTDCDAYDNFLPAMFKPLEVLSRVPGAIFVIGQSLRFKSVRHAPNGFGWLAKHNLDPELTRAWVEPALEDADVRRDVAKVLRGISKHYTLEAAERLARFDRPTLIAWSPEDRFFKFEHAERLAETIPDARLVRIEDSWTYVSLDQPERLAQAISAFVRDTQHADATA